MIWKSIKGFDNYLISERGDVISLNYKRTGIAKQLKKRYTKDGYIHYALRRNGSCFEFRAHTLVANAFIGEKECGMEINHIDEDKTNNHFSNLEYVSHKENMYHNDLHKKCSDRLIESNKKRSKPVVGISKDSGELVYFCSMSEATANGHDPSEISKCCRNQFMKLSHHGFYWRLQKAGEKHLCKK